MKLKSIKQLKKLKGKKVILRVDWNVELDKHKDIDETKIPYFLDTIKHLKKHKAKIILITHLGRPKGRFNKKYSLKPLISKINKKYKLDIKFKKFNIIKENEKIHRSIKSIKDGQIICLENIRFYSQEKENDRAFSKTLAEFGDIYVNDAFSVCHRKHASVVGITKYIPSYAGLLTLEEVKNLNKIAKPKKPSVAILGGAKLNTKLKLLKKLLIKYDHVCLGTLPARVVLKANKKPSGKELIKESKETMKLIKQLSKKYKNKLILPQDVIVASNTRKTAKPIYKKISNVKKTEYILDIGPETIKEYSLLIKKAKTLMWNGPLGMFEVSAFKHGTIIIARMFGARAKGKAFGVIGGGETLAAINQAKVKHFIDFNSTGGGAMLDYLYNPNLPGLKALQKK